MVGKNLLASKVKLIQKKLSIRATFDIATVTNPQGPHSDLVSGAFAFL